MDKIIRLLVACLMLSFLNSCGTNLFSDFAQTKDSYDAIVEDVKLSIDNLDYDAALTHLARIHSSKRETEEVRLLYISAYSGKCGISFVKVADAVSSSGNTSTLIQLALGTANNLSNPDITYCNQAKTEIEKFTAEEVAANGRIPLAGFIVGFVRLGLVAAEFDGNNDGVIEDPGLVCDRNSFTDTKVKMLVTSLNMVLVNLAGFGSSTIPNLDISLLTDLEAVCPGSGSCFSSDEADLAFDSNAGIATPEAQASLATAYMMRSIFATTDFGTQKAGCSFASFSNANDTPSLIAALNNCCPPPP